MAGTALVPVGPAPRPRGRQTTYTKELADEVIDRLSEGEPLARIGRDEGMPKPSTVYDWCDAHPDFAVRFVRAREIGHDAIAYDALEIANTPHEGEERTLKVAPTGTELTIKKADALGHRKLQVDTRIRLLEKWDTRYRGAANLAAREQAERDAAGAQAPEVIVKGGLPSEDD